MCWTLSAELWNLNKNGHRSESVIISVVVETNDPSEKTLI